MRLERRTYVSTKLVIVAPILAILASLSLSGILIILAGVNPFIAYFEIVKGAFGSKLAITETLTRASPLILTGLAAAVAFRARLWNIGGEGQFYIGALVAAAVGNNLLLGLPVVISMTLIMLSAMIAGAVLLAGPALLRLRFGIDEGVTTVLLNFIIILCNILFELSLLVINSVNSSIISSRKSSESSESLIFLLSVHVSTFILYNHLNIIDRVIKFREIIKVY